MKRVAIYCRVSTDFDESLRSLENQILAYIDLVQNNPDWHLQGIYSDRGLSGTSMRHRTSFQRLLRHCEEQKIDLIITKSISRFSRNTHDLLGVLRKLRQLHIDIIFEKEGIRMSEADNEFILTLYAAIAQQEAVNISQNIAWAYNRRALAGKPKFRRLYGYRVIGSGQNQMLESIPEEADIVRGIFKQFNNGRSYSDIIRRLATDGVQTMNGYPVWTRKGLKRLLSNIKYTGNSRIIKKPSKIAELQTEMTEHNGEILITNSHPAIISQEIFDRVQNIIDEQYTPRSEKSTQPVTYVLAGRIRCGHCGANFTLQQKGKREWSYSCATRHKDRNSCPSTIIRESQVLQLMKQAIISRYGSDHDQAVPMIKTELLCSCDLDRAEEERLRRIIEIAKIGQHIQSAADTSTMLRKKKSLAQDFQMFERNLAIAERDLPARLTLADSLSRYLSFNSFINTLSLDEACALIPIADIFSSDAAILTWHDQQQTEIGRCQPAMLPRITTNDISMQSTSTDTIKPIVEQANEKAVIAQSTLQVGQLLQSFQSNQNRKIRVCAYCRTSTVEEQHITSLARQIATYTHLIMTNPNYEFSGIYSDHGKSGLNITNRSGFQQMIDDAKADKFDLIITKSVSRFGRNVVDVLATVKMLKSLPDPVTVIFETESLRSDSPQCDLMLSLHSAVAQNEAFSTSENIRWSNLKSIKKGTYQHHGELPYGYSKDSNGHWAIREDQGSVIHRIFSEYIQGKSPYAIALKLTEEQIPTSGGQLYWRPTAVYRIVNNIVYRGHHLYARLYKPDLTSTKRRTNRGEVDRYLIEDHHPAIIDQSTWEMAQSTSEKRSKQRKNQTAQSRLNDENIYRQKILKKRLICGLCGQGTFYRRHTYKQSVYSYWKCNASIQTIQFKRCHLKSIREEIIEHGIMTCLLRMKHNDNWQQKSSIYSKRIKPDASTDQSINQLKSQQSNLYHKIHTYVKKEQEQNIQLINQVTALTEKIMLINSQINQLEHSKKIANETIDYLNNLSHTLEEIPEFDPDHERITFRTGVFKKLFKSVEIFNNSTIMCNLIFDHSEKIVIKETNLHKLLLKSIN